MTGFVREGHWNPCDLYVIFWRYDRNGLIEAFFLLRTKAMFRHGELLRHLLKNKISSLAEIELKLQIWVKKKLRKNMLVDLWV